MQLKHPQFICIEQSWMTFGPDDQCTWENRQPDKPLLPLKGGTEEEVRKMLNAYLASEDAIAYYGASLVLMDEGKTKLDPQLTCRHGRYWKWGFEVIPFTVDFEQKTVYHHIPLSLYGESSMMEARN